MAYRSRVGYILLKCINSVCILLKSAWKSISTAIKANWKVGQSRVWPNFLAFPTFKKLAQGEVNPCRHQLDFRATKNRPKLKSFPKGFFWGWKFFWTKKKQFSWKMSLVILCFLVCSFSLSLSHTLSLITHTHTHYSNSHACKHTQTNTPKHSHSCIKSYSFSQS